MTSGFGGFLKRGFEKQDVFEHRLHEPFLVLGELQLEQAAGVVMEALDRGLPLAAQAIGQGTAGAGGIGGQRARTEQFGFNTFSFALLELQG